MRNLQEAFCGLIGRFAKNLTIAGFSCGIMQQFKRYSVLYASAKTRGAVFRRPAQRR
ncbi:hypothetical protein CUJ84_Chr004138 [Rhizobium leguminosarum]|uniref:Uncharacterized protein n=1 Tax=Rhizobium leguminosarum TaxID=384 RepID=A0A2K9Z884_RHILE|nr:hypothetical protein CUJ84_Chr004138 [Rhizobium leguminosarum]